MCGVAGWVDFERDLTRERAGVESMTRTMACRGPDDEGVWLEPRVALGHRRLAVIDPAGGRQPMTVEQDGRTLVALTYSGEVYNFTELRQELAGAGHRFRTDSDTEVVLHAYLRWGEDLVHRLNGMYAFAVWDGRTQELLLVRDRMGIKPLFYYPTPHGVLFGSEPKAIIVNPLAEPVVDLDGLREMAAMVKTPGHAVYRGMREVRPGELVRVRRSGLSTRRYWRLEAREHTDDLDTTVRQVRMLLDDIVGRQLVSDVPLCTLLSGGLDSSALTALAARATRAAGQGPIRSFAVDFVNHARHFTPDAARDTPDAPFARELAEYVSADHTDVVLSTSELVDTSHREAVMRAMDVPVGGGDFYTSLYLMFRAVRRNATVALSGESADEVFGGYRWFHDPAAVDADTFPWLALFRFLPPDQAGSDLGLLDRGLVDQLELAEYRDSSYRDALADVPRLAGETAQDRRMREISHLHLTRYVQFLLDRKDRMSMASGLEVRVPFCDHRLVQYVFNTPWSMKTFDGREKSLLRAAVADVLPASILNRRKSPYPATQDPAYDQALRAEFAELATNGSAPLAPLLDRHRSQLVLRDQAGLSRWTRRSVEIALGLNFWLERCDAKLSVAT